MWDFGGAKKIMDNSREAAITFASKAKDEWLKRDDERNDVAPGRRLTAGAVTMPMMRPGL